MSFTGILVEKTGILKSIIIKDYKEEDLYKKCGFKKQDGFAKQNEWVVKFNGDNVLGCYSGYLNERTKYDKKKHYYVLWNEKNIYL